MARELPTHTDDEIAEARDDDNPLVLMPPLVRWTHYSLFVAAYRVEGLPNMDEYSSTDPFIAMKMLHGQSALKSSVKNNTLNPVFNGCCACPSSCRFSTTLSPFALPITTRVGTTT